MKYAITYIPKGIPNNFEYGLLITFSQFIRVLLIEQKYGNELFIKTTYSK
jgi:hypothetical protein